MCVFTRQKTKQKECVFMIMLDWEKWFISRPFHWWSMDVDTRHPHVDITNVEPWVLDMIRAQQSMEYILHLSFILCVAIPKLWQSLFAHILYQKKGIQALDPSFRKGIRFSQCIGLDLLSYLFTTVVLYWMLQKIIVQGLFGWSWIGEFPRSGCKFFEIKTLKYNSMMRSRPI